MPDELKNPPHEITALALLGNELARAIEADAEPPRRRWRSVVAGLAVLALVPAGGFALAEITRDIDPDGNGRLDRRDLEILDRNEDSIVTGTEAEAKLRPGEWLRFMRLENVLDREQRRALERLDRSGRLEDGQNLREAVRSAARAGRATARASAAP